MNIPNQSEISKESAKGRETRLRAVGEWDNYESFRKTRRAELEAEGVKDAGSRAYAEANEKYWSIGRDVSPADVDVSGVPVMDFSLTDLRWAASHIDDSEAAAPTRSALALRNWGRTAPSEFWKQIISRLTPTARDIEAVAGEGRAARARTANLSGICERLREIRTKAMAEGCSCPVCGATAEVREQFVKWQKRKIKMKGNRNGEKN